MQNASKTTKYEEIFDTRYQSLNEEQKKAVDAIDGPVMIVAGPGSGKTEIIAMRIANILKRTDVGASSILCLTFTDSAAHTMKERLAGLIGDEAYRVGIFTFHSFSQYILNRYPEFFYGGFSMNSADEAIQTETIEKILRSLPANHPFSSYHNEHGFVYLSDIQKSISDIKRAGLSPEQFSELIKHSVNAYTEINNIVIETIEKIGRVSKKVFPDLYELVEKIFKLNVSNPPIFIYQNPKDIISSSLKRVLDLSESSDSTVYLTEWKSKNIVKTEEGKSILKSLKDSERMLLLSEIYSQYQKDLNQSGYYDFDDMVIDVLNKLETNEALRAYIQERYQYILVDEFQDTNDAQMRLIKVIGDSFVNEGKPNVMVVGDDDQAIYKFQGATVSNILDFQRIYPLAQIITMTKNYRSGQKILDTARELILKGTERLENTIETLEKELKANREGGIIDASLYATAEHEYHSIAKRIQKLIIDGEDPENIAVISRKHAQLMSLVVYLRMLGIPVSYERKQNVFEEPHIKQIISIARVIVLLSEGETSSVDSLLSEIISYPFWNIDRLSIWKLSVLAKREKKSWMELLSESEDLALKDISEFLLHGAKISNHLPLERMIDYIIGSANHDLFEDPEPFPYISPFRDYYFNDKRFKNSKSTYLSFLSSLKVFVSALRGHKKGVALKLKDMLSFVDVYEKNKIPLPDTSPFTSSKGTVKLLTVHKAKGQEFKNVFIIGCLDSIWASRGMIAKLSFPAHIPLSAQMDNEDDALRAFYVAITRAKDNLFLSTHSTGDDGKSKSIFRFLAGGSVDFKEEILSDEIDATAMLATSWVSYHTPPFKDNEEVLLSSLLDKYTLSVTHLNNFIDLERGGPQFFLEHNLLQFPETKIPSGSFGTAIHSLLKDLCISKRGNKDNNLDQSLELFDKYLKHERLDDFNYQKYLFKGKEIITRFFESFINTLSSEDIPELSFEKTNPVLVNGVPLVGKIDRVTGDSLNKAKVVDYKTGMGFSSWDKSGKSAMKLYKYKNQLLFYKLLIENSDSIPWKKVDEGEIWFVEDLKKNNIQVLKADLSVESSEELKKLISAVYKKIVNLEFPDTSVYPKSFEGTQEFVKDLIEGKI